jgi:phosphoribosylanthranilate isomerase
MKSLKIKVCGMRDTNNIKALSSLQIDFMGFIFYENSSRNATSILDSLFVKELPSKIIKTGVFVNAEVDFIVEKTKKFGLGALQLHGTESVEYIYKLKNNESLKNVKILKAFNVDGDFDFRKISEYAECIDYYLFDAKGKHLGGNGIQFDWEVLKKFTLKKPFFLSGGIDIDDVEKIKNLSTVQQNLFGVDVNSKFEISAGLKDIEKIKTFIYKLKN